MMGTATFGTCFWRTQDERCFLFIKELLDSVPSLRLDQLVASCGTHRKSFISLDSRKRCRRSTQRPNTIREIRIDCGTEEDPFGRFLTQRRQRRNLALGFGSRSRPMTDRSASAAVWMNPPTATMTSRRTLRRSPSARWALPSASPCTFVIVTDDSDSRKTLIGGDRGWGPGFSSGDDGTCALTHAVPLARKLHDPC